MPAVVGELSRLTDASRLTGLALERVAVGSMLTDLRPDAGDVTATGARDVAAVADDVVLQPESDEARVTSTCVVARQPTLSS